MDTNKVKEIFSDQAFMNSLFEMETAAQVKAELKKKGLDVTEEDVMTLKEGFIKKFENGNHQGEMSLDQLDDVAGGNAITHWWNYMTNPPSKPSSIRW